ncbi:MAG: oxidative damage protection protein [Formivibrio sp.]|nr:oxidative damage protection protein [Formivibrio sp.]
MTIGELVEGTPVKEIPGEVGTGRRGAILPAENLRARDRESRSSNTIKMGAPRMAHTVFCVRNKKEMEGLDEPPFDSEFGQKIYKNVSKAAWAEWVDRQKMLLNEYRLQPWTPQAQQFLVEQMEEFFFGAGSALPNEFVPPAQ